MEKTDLILNFRNISNKTTFINEKINFAVLIFFLVITSDV